MRAALAVFGAAALVCAPGGHAAEEPAAAGASSCPHVNRPAQDLRPATARTAMRCLLAAERERSGVRALRPSRPLRRLALALARDQLRRGYRGHVSPEGRDLRARATRKWLPADARRRWELAEAISWGTGQYTTPAALMETLLRSPAHRRFLHDRRYTLGDVGVAGSGDKAIVVVELARVR